MSEQPGIDVNEFETMLQSFNQESTKREICSKIKELKALIEEEPLTGGATSDQDEGQQNKTQKLTLPLSGRVIQVQGNSLTQACELVEAWGKSSKITIQTQESTEQRAG